MSVASTKAFYAQVAAGWLLAVALAAGGSEAAPTVRRDIDGLLRALRSCLTPWSEVLAQREEIGRIAAPWPRRAATGPWWAAVPIGWPPPRCGSSCPSSATGRSPATPPRTRSTSTCPASR